MMRLRAVLISIMLAASVVLTVAAEDLRPKPSAAFERLKSLQGEWQAQSPWGGKSRVRYEVIAGGSAVVETFSDDKLGAGNEMVTVYTPSGDGVALTHYCMAGNQPQMKAESFDSTTGELRFEFLRADNLSSSAAGHMRTAEFRFLGPDRFVSTWNFFEDGKLKNAERMEYTRIRMGGL